MKAKRKSGGPGFTLVEMMIVVGIIGILAAIAIPMLVNRIRQSKVSEVAVTLDRCYQSVLQYYQQVSTTAQGLAQGELVPTAMANPICPAGKGKGAGSFANLSGGANFIDPAVYTQAAGATFKTVGFIVADPAYACYSYDTSIKAAAAPVGGAPAASVVINNGDWFRCIAYTDVDNDDQVSTWWKTGTFDTAIRTFKTGAVYHVPGADW